MSTGPMPLMIYTINESIVYNSGDCTLLHLPTQESVKLSISSGRLLEHILNSKGEILTRDSLLTEVWDKYGLSGSNGNLNQYTSILRRALAAYDCENFIITIPKVGIRLNPDIPVHIEAAAPVVAHEENTAKTPLATRGPRATESRTGPSKKNWLVYLVALLCILLPGGFYLHNQLYAPPLPKVKSLLPGGCEAVFLKNLNNAEKQDLEKQLTEILAENKLSCDASVRVYFDNYTSFSSQNYGRTLASWCKLSGDRSVISCDNVYYLDWRKF